VENYYEYLRAFSQELGARIVEMYPPLQGPNDPLPDALKTLLRQPLPAQALTIAGVAKHLQTARSARIVGECGTGKTLMSLAVAHAIAHTHARGKPYTAIGMCPPHLVYKWSREVFETIPHARAFVIYDLRNGGDPTRPHGVVEVRLKNGKIVNQGVKTTLSELRSMGRACWRKLCHGPAYFIVSRETGKLSYHWKHAYTVAESGPDKGAVTNPDTGLTIPGPEGGMLSRVDFDDRKIFEHFTRGNAGSENFSAVWQADRNKIQRMAPLEFIGRYMKGWWDYAIADELHQLAQETAQGNNLGVLYRCSLKLIGLTGTLMGGYADDLFNLFYRMEPRAMVSEGFAAGSSGRRDFAERYGVLESIEKIPTVERACTRAQKATVRQVRKPGASPLIFGKFLMGSTAFVTLEDIAAYLPSYEESVVEIEMDEDLAKAYSEIEKDIREALAQHRRNRSLMSLMMHRLLLYPDHPFGLGEIWGKVFDPAGQCYEPFRVTTAPDLPQEFIYAKERRLIDDIREQLRQGRRCQVYTTFTGAHDTGARLEKVLRQAGFRVAVLRQTVPTLKREAWYQERLKEGVEVVICHPKLVETGLDLLWFPTIYFYQTGYSLHTLRQASRRSWRIGQRHPVMVKFFVYKGTTQTTCLRLMGKKMLVALMMEGKFSGEGIHSLEADDDMMSAMARELVELGRVGESANAVWADLKRERAIQMPAAPAVPQTPESESSERLEPSFIPELSPVPAQQPLVLVQSNPKRKQKPSSLWPTGHDEGAQMLLFG
jgi:SNF2 family DNA or RNA helicase